VEKYLVTLLPMVISFVGTAIMLRFLIPVLKSKKMGQKILDIGPRWHKDKEGTPTMGGISFLLFITLTSVGLLLYLFFNDYIEKSTFYGMLLTVIYADLNGFIGITDDMRKLKKQKNEGLTAAEKYILQFSTTVLYIFALMRLSAVNTVLNLPFFGVSVDLKILWYLFAVLFLTGFCNAVNLTDGIDGLCGSVSAAVAVFFAIYTMTVGNFGGALISSALFGGMLGFLVYNLHPAKVFMGDTGSLFLGALISGLSLTLGNPLILFLVGIIYLLEAVSVIIQVLVFKLTGKRVFLMAPLHHHFEKKGLSEGKITLASVMITLAASVLVFYFN